MGRAAQSAIGGCCLRNLAVFKPWPRCGSPWTATIERHGGRRGRRSGQPSRPTVQALFCFIAEVCRYYFDICGGVFLQSAARVWLEIAHFGAPEEMGSAERHSALLLLDHQGSHVRDTLTFMADLACSGTQSRSRQRSGRSAASLKPAHHALICATRAQLVLVCWWRRRTARWWRRRVVTLQCRYGGCRGPDQLGTMQIAAVQLGQGAYSYPAPHSTWRGLAVRAAEALMGIDCTGC